MFSQWMGSDFSTLPFILTSGIGAYGLIIIFTRLTGLRSFSKMSAPDFAMTVAVGSIFGSIIANPNPNLINGALALAFLFIAQFFLAYIRKRSRIISNLLDNQPVLLMSKGKFLYNNLKKCNVTRDDVLAKLREGNALHLEAVHAVVFETTGDISVLHDSEIENVDSILLEGVQR